MQIQKIGNSTNSFSTNKNQESKTKKQIGFGRYLGPKEAIEVIQSQRDFFKTGVTKKIPFRMEQLGKLLSAIKENEPALINALRQDLGKHEFDAYAGDINLVKKFIKFQLNHIKKWTKPERVPSTMLGSKSFIYREPYGDVLVVGTWNYPVSTLIESLAGAITAGNCATLKPSEVSENTSKVINEIISKTFKPEYVKVIEGGIDETQFLLDQKFDKIFFTGSQAVGKIVAAKAAKNLTSVVLELGGKSPCIVDKNTDLSKTAHRIMWGKLLNNGQTCVAPDYVLVHEGIKDEFIAELRKTIKEFYGEDPQKSEFYSRIINERHFDRLESYLNELREGKGTIIHGGRTDRSNLYVEPTLVVDVSPDSKIMQEEIFGPILPIRPYGNIDEAIEFIQSGEKPLALYVFTKDNTISNKVISETSAGGMCVNDTLLHGTSQYLPFGGVGNSGMGKSHGRYIFDEFSNKKGLLENTFGLDRGLLYPPYDKLPFKCMKKIVDLFT